MRELGQSRVCIAWWAMSVRTAGIQAAGEQFAVRVLHSRTPYYAPMAARLVDRTMMRSLWASAQRVAAVVLGMIVA